MNSNRNRFQVKKKKFYPFEQFKELNSITESFVATRFDFIQMLTNFSSIFLINNLICWTCCKKKIKSHEARIEKLAEIFPVQER